MHSSGTSSVSPMSQAESPFDVMTFDPMQGQSRHNNNYVDVSHNKIVLTPRTLRSNGGASSTNSGLELDALHVPMAERALSIDNLEKLADEAIAAEINVPSQSEGTTAPVPVRQVEDEKVGHLLRPERFNFRLNEIGPATHFKSNGRIFGREVLREIVDGSKTTVVVLGRSLADTPLLSTSGNNQKNNRWSHVLHNVLQQVRGDEESQSAKPSSESEPDRDVHARTVQSEAESSVRASSSAIQEHGAPLEDLIEALMPSWPRTFAEAKRRGLTGKVEKKAF